MILGARGMAALACATVVITGCGQAVEPAASPTPLRTATPAVATPTPAPTPTATQSPVAYEGRHQGMSDDEALARAEHPVTGEEWLDAPVAVDPPSWIDAAWGDLADELTGGWWEWHRIGTHDGRDIYAAGPDTTLLFEASPDGGEVRYIAGPEPYAEPWPWPWGDVPDGVVADADTYYDSLALPRAWRSPEGWSLDVRSPGGVRDAATAAPVSTFGPTGLTRWSGPAYSGYDDAELAAIADASMRFVAYSIRLPYGLVRSVPPPRPSGSPSFDAASGAGWEPDQVFIDFLDQGCDTFEPVTVLEGPDLSTWRTVGSWDGAAVVAPSSASAIAEPTWRAWRTHRELEAREPIDSEAATVGAFVDAPAVLGLPTADGTGLRLLLNGAFRMRAWC